MSSGSAGLTTKQLMASIVTEDQLLTAITEAATLLGWRWHHVRRSDKALQQGHAGFPDLVLAKNGRVIFLELKSETGRLTKAQEAWAGAIDPRVTGVYYWLVRPSDFDELLEFLK